MKEQFSSLQISNFLFQWTRSDDYVFCRKIKPNHLFNFFPFLNLGCEYFNILNLNFENNKKISQMKPFKIPLLLKPLHLLETQVYILYLNKVKPKIDIMQHGAYRND